MRIDADERSDQDHLQSVARGDQRAFGVLFERHSDFVYNVAFRRTASWSAAEDITETVFLELWRQRHRVSTLDGSIRPWLAGVVTNLARRWWRDAARKARAVERLTHRRDGIDGDGAFADPAEVVPARLDDERQMQVLLEAVAELPDDQRDVVTLWAWEQLSYEEIATALGIAVGTVRSRLSRARARLRGFAGTAGGPGAYIAGSQGATEAMPPSAERGGCG